jgi:hypothetical protein
MAPIIIENVIDLTPPVFDDVYSDTHIPSEVAAQLVKDWYMGKLERICVPARSAPLDESHGD